MEDLPTTTAATRVAQGGYKVRELTHKDLKALKAIIASGADDAKKQLTDAAREIGRGSEQAAGVMIFTVVLDHFDDVMYWLGDLAGMGKEEFDKQPFDAHLDILELLIEKDNLADFFGRYMKLRQTFSSALSRKSQ